MTRDVLFIQGGGEGVHDEWDSRLVASLRRELGSNYHVSYPRMPNEADPHYATWKPAIAREVAALGDGGIVVGHSLGATMLVNFLAETMPNVKLAGVFLLAAPFIGDGGWESEEIHPPRNLGARFPAGVPLYLYHGSKDQTAPVAHVDLYARALPRAVVRRLEGRDHQLDDDLSEVARDIERLR